MTFAISKELQFFAGHDFYVKLTLVSIAKPLQSGSIYTNFVLHENAHKKTPPVVPAWAREDYRGLQQFQTLTNDLKLL